ncbi:trifunctional uridine nucleosidase/nicotinamide riboside hydrolase/nicotinic acid riboside hydrolase SCDLUD_003271 [Saccharomycodes ludwigii]|uniref:trifunctional uridine nucleosidase/nicotinamide riboside hydrolase/nicotinic acid riboside hydrolase n=1 Tax=Saccharomycodes ludwigii TaxID=36035 RepID=UPI001E87DDAA|nr:hypothetical protein SCDLUD_003271 [Saccharomycodes ludwigii]KAH3900299.1 hypothetical protein SCDLUD_003271 [Saccharomycodes ludwigii]
MTNSSLPAIPIWLDCDPGHDDAVAILMACKLPQFKLVGISASYGNSTPLNTLKNTISILQSLNEKMCTYQDITSNDNNTTSNSAIPIYKGAQEPLVKQDTGDYTDFDYEKDSYTAPEIHGDSGLDGTTLLPKPDETFLNKLVPSTNSTANYFDFIKGLENALLQYPNELVYVSTASLTSLATFCLTKPHLKKNFKYISAMGGSFYNIGNRNPKNTAEFNIYIDPHAANCIFQDPILQGKIFLAPLNLTHKAIATEEVMEKIKDYHGTTVITSSKSNSMVRKMFYELFLFFKTTYSKAQGAQFIKGPPVHDPLTLMPLLQFINNDKKVDFKYKVLDIFVIEDEKNKDYGRTLAVKEHKSTEITSLGSNISKGIIVGFDMNIDYFWDKVHESLELA